MRITSRRIVLASLLLGLGLLISTPVFAQGVTGSIIGALGSSNLPAYGKTGTIEVVTGRVIQAFLSVFGIIFLSLMIYGGYKWMMASGREEEVTKAKDLIRAAIIGLAIVMSSYIITVYVVSAFTRATQTGSDVEAECTDETC